MSTTQVPPRARGRNDSSLPGLGEVSRARHIVATLGGRFSLELGIDVDRDGGAVDRWVLAATVLGAASPVSVATHTYCVLERAGVRTLEDVRSLERVELALLLEKGGYARHDESAARLLVLSEVVADRYPTGLASVGETYVCPDELERALGALPGWDTVVVGTFLRELRGVWPGADPALDPRAALAARHVALPSDLHGLSAVAAATHVDFRDLEAGLTRLALTHDSAHCPGGEECPLVEADPEQFVHF